MQSAIEELENKAKAAKAASRKLAHLPTEVKNKALANIAESLMAREGEILDANRLDCEDAKASGMEKAMLDRLVLNSSRLQAMAQDVRTVASLPDPVGEIIDTTERPNGLRIERRRVPLGVIGVIFESRPNVTVDISSLCLKSGNAVILRGGKEALRSNSALARVIREAAQAGGVPGDAIQFIESPERELVSRMLKMSENIDLIIPRGGEQLVALVTGNATMPVLASGVGICHTYVDRTADLEKAVAIAVNAKVQRPTVCNALDCLLVHSEIAERYLPMIATEWAQAGVEMRCDERALKILFPNFIVVPASESDWGKEFLALIAAVKVVDSLDEALEHIARYNSGHSEAIITEDDSEAARFLEEVDAACVYVNASTRFTDGGQFGLGAEVGISTQKFHARGPMGLRELTTYKWVIMGSGQVRA
ncbi:MAG: glutamate-5-semialdehyde dehydrogenase [Dehalococcoidia bacterium]|nr:MAG: glutamate-5-semialdehyde dehydrogenase [Dehalococcoidia bacterium]